MNKFSDAYEVWEEFGRVLFIGNKPQLSELLKFLDTHGETVSQALQREARLV